MLTEIFRLALGNLGRARTRLLMTAGGVIVGTSSVILLLALSFGLQQAAESGLGSNAALSQIDVMQAYHENGAAAPQLNDEAVAALRRIEGVRVVVPTLRLQGGEILAGDYTGYADVMGIDPALLPALRWQTAEGEISLQPGQVIIGAMVAQSFYDPDIIEEFTAVSVNLMTTPLELRVYNYSHGSDRAIAIAPSAILAETGSPSDYNIYMPLEDVKTWNEWITGQDYQAESFVYDQITVVATSRETAPAVIEAIRALGFEATGMGDYLRQLNSFFVTMRFSLGAVACIALLVAAFGIANTMMMAILERTREIGIMKAIGANNETILSLFLLEAALVGFFGGLAAVIISQFLKDFINRSLQNLPQGEELMNFLPINPTQIGSNLILIPQELIIFALLLATGVGVVAGLYPAWRAARMSPVLALRHD
jgi:putative ABC transport system permease protein